MSAQSFSPRDLVRLERALRVLLHPTAESPYGWLEDVSEVVGELAGTYVVVGVPTSAGDQRMVSRQLDEQKVAPYRDYFFGKDFVSHRLMARTELVGHAYEVTSRDELLASEVYNDYALVNRVHGPIIMHTAAGPDAVRAWAAFDHVVGPDELETHAALLRAVAPAFVAGVSAWRRAEQARAGMGRLLDAMSDAVALCELSGRIAHANAKLSALFGGPAGAALRTAIESSARSLAALAPGASGARRADASLESAAGTAAREITTAAGRFRLRGSFAGEGVLGGAPHVLVTVEPVAAAAQAPLTDADLAARFSLTEREIEIARLMAEGLGNKEIGARLGLSFYTARNHAERVMGKLGASGRGRVGPILSGR